MDHYLQWFGIDVNTSTELDTSLGLSSFGYKYEHFNANIGFSLAGYFSKKLNIDYKFTALHRYFQLLGTDFDYSLALAEFGYKDEHFNIDIGFSLADYINTTKEINNVSFTLWDDAYKLKIGKFVTRVGVMDYLTSFEIFNPIRYSFYNDENKNISRYPKEMIEASIYMEDDSKLTFYVKQYDDEIGDLFYVGNYALFNNFIPFLLNSEGDSDVGLIAQEVFSPLYYDYGKPNSEPLFGNTYNMLSPDISHSGLGVNFLLNSDDFIVGAVWLNSHYKIPLLKPEKELLEGLENLLEEDKERFIENYLSQNNVNNILEFVRYNKVGLYFETSVNNFGFRGELSYEDKTPILNELSSQFSVALGLDYKGFKMYNSLEFQGNYLEILDEGFYQGIWVTEADPIHLDFFDLDFIDLSSLTLNVDHSFYYVKYDSYDYYFSKPSIGLQYKNMEFTLEYYYSSDYAIVEDSFIWLFRISY
ncbi:MAG: hypothetical protein HKP62_01530 [Sulfurovum sp.]|nr:hypothetical protein [Sulfurovum sp.]NNJ44676.1 hypothetical protein [Sulfurovum sp.]